MQTKSLSFNLDIKFVSGRKFDGYGSVFGNKDLGGDIVVRGAFTATLRKHKDNGTMPLMFWMHDPTEVPGVWTDMEEDEKGLYVAGELVDTALGRDVRTLLEKKAVRGLSIGYVPDKIDYDREGNRLLKQVDLIEVSIVSMAMNPMATVVGMKARISPEGEYVPTERELERLFRKAGCSQVVAKRLVARLCDPADIGTMPAHRDGDVIDQEDEAKALLAALRNLEAGVTLSAALSRLPIHP